MTRPVFGNDPDVVRIANLTGRLGKVEHRAKTGPWIEPTILGGATDVGAPHPTFAYRVNYAGASHDWRGRLANVTDGLVVCNVAARWRLDHDYERTTVAEAGGVRSAASIYFDAATGDVTVYLL